MENNCTTGHDAHTFCPDENCSYHKAVAELETEKAEKLKNHIFDTTEYVKISVVNPRIDSLNFTISDLIEKNNAAQAEMAMLKEELKEKNESGCCIVEHGYRMAAEHELAAFKERWNKDGVIIDDLKRDNQNLQSALEVAVEGLDEASHNLHRIWCLNEGFEEDFAPRAEEISFNGHKAVEEVVKKIKQIRGEK